MSGLVKIVDLDAGSLADVLTGRRVGIVPEDARLVSIRVEGKLVRLKFWHRSFGDTREADACPVEQILGALPQPDTDPDAEPPPKIGLFAY